MNELIYLDNAATTRPSERALAAAADAAREYGNPSSPHAAGTRARRLLEDCRARVAATMRAEPERVVFTSSGTEANNLAILGAARALGKNRGKIITTQAEHPSVHEAAARLESEGFEVVRLPAAGGVLDLAALDRELDGAILVSVMAVNNETGARFDMVGIAEVLKRRFPDKKKRPLLHCDAVQEYGKRPLFPERMGVDLMSVSAHKIHGLKGTGALYAGKGVRLAPLLAGGGQEGGLRPSTENLPGIAAFAAAAEECVERMDEDHDAAISLKETAAAGLGEIPGVTVNSFPDASPYILSFAVEGVRGEVMVNHLSALGIYVSSGAACSAAKRNASANRILLAHGMDATRAASTLRVGLGRGNTARDVEALIKGVRDGAARLRAAPQARQC